MHERAQGAGTFGGGRNALRLLESHDGVQVVAVAHVRRDLLHGRQIVGVTVTVALRD